jgi:hypothetical protein
MGDQLPEFEGADKKGTTKTFAGSVSTSWTPVPNPAGEDIQEFNVSIDPDEDLSKYLEVSFDSGTTVSAKIYPPTGQISGIFKNDQRQIWLKGSIASVNYKVTLAREPN